MVNQPGQGAILPGSALLIRKEKDVTNHHGPKMQKRSEDRELNQERSKPDTVVRPVRIIAHTFVHHYNSTQYCNTETVLLIFPFLQTRCNQVKVRGS